jgi:Ca2+-binding EF-hand superfamily protein
MKTKAFIILAVIVFPLAVFAGEKSASKSAFKSLDKDNDGYISMQEAKGNKDLIEKWDTVDADTDGKLEMSEFSAFETGTAASFTPPEKEGEEGIGAAPTK